MGSDQILKKSVLGGFKKEGVLNYIEQLQTEILSLKKDVNENSAYKTELETLKSEQESSNKDLESLKTENEALKAENASLIEKNAAYALKIEEAQVTIADYESKQRQWEEKIASIEAKFAEIESSCSKYGEADSKADSVIRDAMNYSERMINDAKTSADEITEVVGGAVRAAKSEVSGANDRIKTACVNFDSSASALRASVENLMNVLSEIADKIDKIGGEKV